MRSSNLFTLEGVCIISVKTENKNATENACVSNEDVWMQRQLFKFCSDFFQYRSLDTIVAKPRGIAPFRRNYILFY